ncbi:MAG: S1 RNA-binding domain-containing protein [Xanthomonadaceae bacterium]|nr:S1 RNA-binding domain-containing protein [Xanthomonadaceae bacterium]
MTRFEPFGAFVELAPGVDGLVHISEIAWSRIGNHAEVLNLGQEVTVKLLKRELLNGKAKLSLSIKQVTPREDKDHESQAPKQDLWAKYQVGQIYAGTVKRKEQYGLFLEIDPGVTGLLHKSRTDGNHEFHFEKTRVGDTVSAQIVEIKLKERQIALGLPKDGGEDDWRGYLPKPVEALGTLAERMQAALSKKKI